MAGTGASFLAAAAGMLVLVLCPAAVARRRAAALGSTGRGDGSAGGRPAPPERWPYRPPCRHPGAGGRRRAGGSRIACPEGPGGARQAGRRADAPAGSGRSRARPLRPDGRARRAQRRPVAAGRVARAGPCPGADAARRGGARGSDAGRSSDARARPGAGCGPTPPSCRRRPSALADSTGRFRIVRGRVLRVAPTESYVYLNFGADWRADFTVRVRRTELESALAGVDLEGLARTAASRCAASCSRRAAR